MNLQQSVFGRDQILWRHQQTSLYYGSSLRNIKNFWAIRRILGPWIDPSFLGSGSFIQNILSNNACILRHPKTSQLTALSTIVRRDLTEAFSLKCCVVCLAVYQPFCHQVKHIAWPWSTSRIFGHVLLALIECAMREQVAIHKQGDRWRLHLFHMAIFVSRLLNSGIFVFQSPWWKPRFSTPGYYQPPLRPRPLPKFPPPRLPCCWS